jgi:heterodisulfide reductase subunit C
MVWVIAQDGSAAAFAGEVEKRTGQRLATCYQCGKCTAGCPTAFSMDYPPNQVMRGVQLGMRDTVLHSRTIWLCASCETCTTRCPQGVDVAAVMDGLRQMAYAEGIRTTERDVTLFHRLFLSGVRQHGRVYETGLMGLFNVLSGHLTKDLVLAPMMFLKGKLGLLPPRVGKVRSLKQMYKRAAALEAKSE